MSGTNIITIAIIIVLSVVLIAPNIGLFIQVTRIYDAYHDRSNLFYLQIIKANIFFIILLIYILNMDIFVFTKHYSATVFISTITTSINVVIIVNIASKILSDFILDTELYTENKYKYFQK